MTKQELIQKAYGERYESSKNQIDENGFIHFKLIDHGIGNANSPEEHGFLDSVSEIETSYDNSPGNYKWRPRSLFGIEYNNGWTKIENDEDLPDIHDSRYFIPCERGNPRLDYSINSITIRKGFHAGVITHWRPIEETIKPLY